MLIDGRSVPAGTTVDADVCIIGAGPAGISLALKLVALSRASVVLLESGGFAFDPDVQALARGETTGLPYYPLHETRVRMVGGSTQSWGGICTPLDPPALRARPWVARPGWPFGPDALDAYLEEALDRCGVDADTQAIDDAAHARRRETWPLDSGVVEPVELHFSRPRRFGAEFRSGLRASERVILHLNATATELRLASGGDAIGEVVVRRLGDSPEGSYRIRAAIVVLAAGGVENARLMLASNADRPAGVGNGNGEVGRGFMEHPRLVLRYGVRAGRTPLGSLIEGGAAGTLRFLRLGITANVQERDRLLAWHANLQPGFAGQLGETWPAVRRLGIATRPPWNESPFFQDGGGGRTRIRSADIGAILRRPDQAALGAVAALRGAAALRRFVEISAAIEQLPDPANRIELTAVRDVLGVPRARITWRIGAEEERTHRRSLGLVLDQLDRIEPGIASRALEPDDRWPAGLVGTWHHVGATRMSGDPAVGVVDADCRSHEVDNLYLAGSSVFPVAGSAAPTVAIVQLALRLADHLAERLALPAPTVEAG